MTGTASTNNDLLQTTDAQVWAERFLDVIGAGDVEIDAALMIAWFANAIETGREAGRKAAWSLVV